jgi:predicted DsbA family dithiol-disulfide isomerase
MKRNVIVTSDFICPWCYLGKARLFKAIASLGGVGVDVSWRPYELNPEMPPEGMDRKTYRSRKFGWERSLQMDAQLTELGRQDGISFNFEKIKVTPNTRMAHRLTLFALRHGKETPYAMAAFEAYFTDGRDIGRRDVLLGLMDKVSLDKEEAAAFLDSSDGLQEVIDAEREAMVRGIRGVPHFDIGALSVSGAQEWQSLRTALLLPHS